MPPACLQAGGSAGTMSRAHMALGAALAGAFAIWIGLLGRPDFPLDDAYITLHNAAALIAGGDDPAYGVAPLRGATSPVHLLVVAAFGTLMDLRWAASAAAWLGAVAYLFGLLAAARQRALPAWATASVVGLGAIAGMSAYHLVNGLETGLAMAGVVWAMVLASGPPGWRLPLLLGALPFVRPELALLAVPLFLRQAWLRRSAGAPKRIAPDLAASIAAALPWLAWMWIETGAIVPQTGGAKVAFFAEAGLPAMAKALSVIGAIGTFVFQIGPLILGFIGLRMAPAGRPALLFVAAMLMLFGFTLPGGLYHNWSRYLYLVVPLLILGLADMLAKAEEPGARRRAGIVLGVSFAFAAAILPLHVNRLAEGLAFTRTELAGVAAWVRAHVPRDAVVAVHDAGYMAFAAERRLVDIVGLKTPAAQAAHEALTGPTRGAARGEALARILAESHVSYFVVWNEWDAIFGLTAGLRAAGVTLTRLRGEGAYAVYRLGER